MIEMGERIECRGTWRRYIHPISTILELDWITALLTVLNCGLFQSLTVLTALCLSGEVGMIANTFVSADCHIQRQRKRWSPGEVKTDDLET